MDLTRAPLYESIHVTAQLRLLTSLCISDMPTMKPGAIAAAAAWEVDETVDGPVWSTAMENMNFFLPSLRVLKVCLYSGSVHVCGVCVRVLAFSIARVCLRVQRFLSFSHSHFIFFFFLTDLLCSFERR